MTLKILSVWVVSCQLTVLGATALADPKPIFSLKALETIAKGVAGLSEPAGKNRKYMIDEAHRRIYDAYPELIVPPGKGSWVFNAVGGALAEMKILFCSPNEYIALWGAPITTEGFSGRYHKLDVWDIMLDGRMYSYAPGQHQYDTYMNSGSDDTHQTSWLKRGVGKHFKLEDGTYMIDYGRGDLMSALGAGAKLGHKYVTGDRDTMRKILNTCAQETFKNWLNADRKAAIKKYRATNPD